jgi:hypothetical protein
MMMGPAQFNLNAAWLRRANGGMKAFMQCRRLRAHRGRSHIDQHFSKAAVRVRPGCCWD